MKMPGGNDAKRPPRFSSVSWPRFMKMPGGNDANLFSARFSTRKLVVSLKMPSGRPVKSRRSRRRYSSAGIPEKSCASSVTTR